MQHLWQHFRRHLLAIAILSTLTSLARSPGAEPTEAAARGTALDGHTVPLERVHQAPPFDCEIDGLIVVVDCSETMSVPPIRNSTQWTLSIILDAAPDGIPISPEASPACPEGIPASLILFGHNPAAPKNLVEIVNNQRLVPLTWRAKSTYRRAVHQTMPAGNRVFLSGALNVARDVVLTSDLKRVAIVVLTDGLSPGEKLELAIHECLDTPAIAAIRVIRMGAPEPPASDKFDSLFHGGRLSLGYARTTEELTDSLRPIAAALD
jgi:hypothetical protein